MRAAREIHAQRAETADEVLIQLDTIASRDTAALTQLERAGAALLASGSLTSALQTYLKTQQGLVQQELATRRVLARLAGEEPEPTRPPEPAAVAPARCRCRRSRCRCRRHRWGRRASSTCVRWRFE